MAIETEAELQQACQRLQDVRSEIEKVLVGQKELIDLLLIGSLAGGHLLLEGVPGVAKTLAVTTFAKIFRCDCKRIQFTPDLLPADLVGTQVYHPKEGSFSIKKGPIFTQIVLADEINRAPAKVQSALLEAMQEKQVSIGGETFPLPSPFFVLATQNPIEQEGTYPLSEAQTDRFLFKITIHYPAFSEEKEILQRMGTKSRIPEPSPLLDPQELLQWQGLVDCVEMDTKLVDYLLQLVFATRFPKKIQFKEMEGLLEYGASPRASLGLQVAAKAAALLEGRSFVLPQDLRKVIYPVLRHRLRLSYEAEAENVSADQLIDRLLDFVPSP